MVKGEIMMKEKKASFTVVTHDKEGREIKNTLKLPDTKTKFNEITKEHMKP